MLEDIVIGMTGIRCVCCSIIYQQLDCEIICRTNRIIKKIILKTLQTNLKKKLMQTCISIRTARHDVSRQYIFATTHPLVKFFGGAHKCHTIIYDNPICTLSNVYYQAPNELRYHVSY